MAAGATWNGEKQVMTFILPQDGGPSMSVADAYSEWSRSLERLMQPQREGGIEADLLSMTADMQEAAFRLWMTSWGLSVPAVGPAPVEPAEAEVAPRAPEPQAKAAGEGAAVAQIMPFARADASVAVTPEIDPTGDFDDAHVTPTAPSQLAGPDGKPDDLLVIKGIGPKLGRLLNDLGIWHYRQIGAWSAPEIAWVNAKMDFKGRVQRERWVSQARALAGMVPPTVAV